MKKIRLFACCIPVRGAKKSIICDIQRNAYKPIPNSMYDFLVKYENQSIAAIKNDFPIEDHETIDEYVDFLLKEEFAFFTDNPEFYPKLEPQWKSPSKITNAVIDNNEYSTHDYASIFSQLDELRCLNIELRFFDVCNIEQLEEIISLTQNGTLSCIDIILKFDITLMDRHKLKDIQARHLRVNNIFIHSTPDQFIESLNTDDNLIYTSQVIENQNHCGIINKSNFSANQNLFFESQSFNNCLNKKISIDSSGQIKNCPSMAISFGDIQNTDLRSVIEIEEFTKNWGITKDQVDTCRDCEFRYICTDCRVYVKNANDPFSKPQKCHYNPYLAIWE